MRVLANFHSEPLDDAAWDSFVAESPEGRLLQTSRWGELKACFGGGVIRYLGAYDDVYVQPLYWLDKQAGAFLQRELGETWDRLLRSG